jgi:hypothetical protein
MTGQQSTTARTLASTAALAASGIDAYRASRGRMAASIDRCAPLEVPMSVTRSGRLPSDVACVLSQRMA